MNADSDRQAATRLRRAVLTTTAGAAATSASHREAHRQTNWLWDVILVRMVVIGLGAAAIGFAVGRLFNVGG
jgi:hypothetical protein